MTTLMTSYAGINTLTASSSSVYVGDSVTLTCNADYDADAYFEWFHRYGTTFSPFFPIHHSKNKIAHRDNKICYCTLLRKGL